ncbi:MAG: KID repeat protein [candidate division TM6 bacterium GW2011_GWF2_28_16]|nr:MAG: KID repeat protein [candidate division TM6 bacterium GW2011_GWF2_28_16]
MSKIYINKIILFLIILFFNNNIYSTIKFSTPSSSIVLSNRKTYFGAPNTSTINGWYGQNLIREAGYENIKTFNDTLRHDYAPQQKINNTFSNYQVSTDTSLNPALKVIYLNDDITLPASTTFTITSSGVIDGLGKNFNFASNAQLLIDTNVSLTLKNITFKNTFNTKPIIKNHDSTGQITFDNCNFSLSNSFTFERGRFFIINNVNFNGNVSFVQCSVRPLYILQHSTFNFAPGSSFMYSPYSDNNNLMIFKDKTSRLKFNNSSLKLTDTGLRLTKGTLYLDNKVTLSASDKTFANCIMIGNATAGSDYDMDTYILSGARVHIDGKVLLDNSTSAANTLNFSNKTGSVVIKYPWSKFKITNKNGISGWNQQSIIYADGSDNSWVTDSSTYGFGIGETKPPTYLVYNNSNAILSYENRINYNSNAIIKLKTYDVKNNSNAILKNTDDIRYNSNAIVSSETIILQEKITQNSNAIISQDKRIRYNSNAILNVPRLLTNNSNAILSLEDEIGYVSSATINNKNNINYNSNAILNNQNNIKYNSNAILNNQNNININTNNISYNSSAILKQEDKITYNSNAILELQKPITNNSNAIILLDKEVEYVSNTTINNKNSIKNNSNAIINNKNNIKYNSNAIINNKNNIIINANNISYNSSAILKQEDKIRWNSSAILNSEASILQEAIKHNSDAIINLTPTGLDQEITNNSNAIILQEAKIRWNSNAILGSDAMTLQDDIKHNSDAIIYLDATDLDGQITNNSNAIILQDDKIRHNSDAIVSSDSLLLQTAIKHNSDAIIVQDIKIIYNSNAIITNTKNIKNNSNAIINNKNNIKNNSNAIINNFKNINNNSNAIINNKNNIKYNSNAILNNQNNININVNNIRYNSNAIINNLNNISYNSSAIINIYNNGLAINNSNAIIYIKTDLNYISNATIENDKQIRYNSNVIITYNLPDLQAQIKHNSDAIVSSDASILLQDVINNSNAIILINNKVRYNSQAIIHDIEIETDLQAQIKHNSDAIISMDVSILADEIKHNSDAILNINAGPEETILTKDPITGDISLDKSVFIHPDQKIHVVDNATIDGNGAVVIFGSPDKTQFTVEKGKIVTLKNIQLLRINQNTFDLRYNAYVDSSSPSNWLLDDGVIKIGQNVLFGLSENITMTQGLIELINNDAGDAQTFKLVGIEGQKQFQIAPSNAYCNALSRADNGLTWAQRVAGYTSYTPSQLPTRFTNNGTMPILIKCNDNTFGIQNINLSGFEHITKTTSIDYTGALGLLGTAAVDIGDETFTEFEKNKNIQEKYDMVFVVQNINNQLRLLKDDLLFTGQLQFADYGENVLDIDTVLTERIKAKAGSTDPERTIPQVNFATDFLQLTSLYGMARLIFDDSRIRINNQDNAFIAYENSYLGGNTIEITGDPIWDLYDPAFGGKEFVLDVDELIGLDDIDNKPIVSDFYSVFRNKTKKLKTSLDLDYENEIKNIINNNVNNILGE